MDGACGTEGGVVMIGKLVTNICKNRLIKVCLDYSCFKIITENSPGQSFKLLDHRINANNKIIGFLGMNSTTKDEAAIGKCRNKYLALCYLAGLLVYIE